MPTGSVQWLCPLVVSSGYACWLCLLLMLAGDAQAAGGCAATEGAQQQRLVTAGPAELGIRHHGDRGRAVL